MSILPDVRTLSTLRPRLCREVSMSSKRRRKKKSRRKHAANHGKRPQS
ncbi:hypothetical protein AB0B40_28475 [Streptomyces sp. NPDC042638]